MTNSPEADVRPRVASPETTQGEVGVARARPIDELITASSIGHGLTNIRENGTEAELAELARIIPTTRKKARTTRKKPRSTKKRGDRPQARTKR